MLMYVLLIITARVSLAEEESVVNFTDSPTPPTTPIPNEGQKSTQLATGLLNKLPSDMAEEMKWMAWDASWHTVNTRNGYKGDAIGDKIRFEEHADKMLSLSAGLGVHGSTLDHIKWGAWYSAWHTADVRAGNLTDAKQDIAKLEEHFEAVNRNNEFTAELLRNIREMCWHAAWHCANIRVGYNEEAKGGKALFEYHARQISGEVNLMAIKFTVEKARVLSVKPKTIAEHELINKSNLEQLLEFEVTYSKGSTTSWNKEIGFKVGTKKSEKASFSILTESELEVSFETTYENERSTRFSETGVQDTAEFGVKVSPNATLLARVVVQEAQIAIPYEMTLDIGGCRRIISGIWEGLAYSRISSEFDERPTENQSEERLAAGQKI